MPVLQVAIGRRLGYPLYLAHAKEHFFARWEECGGERFNVECTNGFVTAPDDYYRQGRYECTDAEVAEMRLLRNLSPREELGWALVERFNCLLDNLRVSEAHQALTFADRLMPDDAIVNGKRAVATILSRMLLDARIEQGVGGYDYSRVDLRNVRVPKATEDWHHFAIPVAMKQIERIDRIRRKRPASDRPAANGVCWPSATESTTNRRLPGAKGPDPSRPI
jgi:hypothetical protein